MRYYLRKTKRGYWEAAWTEAEGKSQRHSLRTKNKRLAQERLAQFEAEHSKPVHEIRTVNDVCKAYIAEKKTVHKYHKELVWKLTPIQEYLGDLLVTQVTSKKAKDYYKWRKKADSTVRTEIAYLKAALHWARDHEGVEVREFDHPCPPSKPRDKWLTRDQARELLDACASPHLRLFIVIAIGTGQRSISICELQWSGVDWENETIDFGENVGNKHRPVARMNEQVRRELQIAYQMRRTDNVIEWNGKPVKDVKGALIRTAKKVGHDTLGKHVFRHTCATWMVMERRSYEEIGKMIGTTKETVERVYGHHHPDYLKEAADTLKF